MPTIPRAGRVGHTKPNYCPAWNLGRLRSEMQRGEPSKTRAAKQTLSVSLIGETESCLPFACALGRKVYLAKRSSVWIFARRV